LGGGINKFLYFAPSIKIQVDATAYNIESIVNRSETKIRIIWVDNNEKISDYLKNNEAGLDPKSESTDCEFYPDQ
jgi:hypothetical protein